jgi:hypothetical protein
MMIVDFPNSKPHRANMNVNMNMDVKEQLTGESATDHGRDRDGRRIST